MQYMGTNNFMMVKQSNHCIISPEQLDNSGLEISLQPQEGD